MDFRGQQSSQVSDTPVVTRLTGTLELTTDPGASTRSDSGLEDRDLEIRARFADRVGARETG